MAVQAGSEAFHNWKRKGLTVICLLLASAVAMGTSVYVDSFSVHEWSRVTDFGPVSMSIQTQMGDIEIETDEIRNIYGVERVHSIAFTGGRVGNLSQHEYRIDVIASMETEYYSGFPDVFQIQTGHFPRNVSEIAVRKNVAVELDLHVDDWVNCTRGLGSLTVSNNLRVVGLFDLGKQMKEAAPNLSPLYVHSTIGIVVPELLAGLESETIVHAGIDRTPLTPFNVQGSWLYVSNIERQIRELDSQYTVRNYLANSITDYREWQGEIRVNQLFRAGGLILLIILLDFLAVRHNFNERRYETELLLARGASRKNVDTIILKELGILSAVGALLGLFLGILLSRIALSSTGYFVFEPGLLLSEPLLITLESFLLSGLVGLLIPFFTVGGYFLIFRLEVPIESERGKLARIVMGLRLIRWDLLVVSLSSVAIILVHSLGFQALGNPYLSFILSILPLVLFAAVSSLTIKALRFGSLRISRVFERVVGKLPARIGRRRIGKSASSAGPAIIVLVLAISLAWNMSVIAASLPETKKIHARFAFGGDASFHLDPYHAHNWEAFLENVSSHPMIEHTALISTTEVFLSTDYENRVSLAAIDPSEYAQVGYDYTGTLLNNSQIMSVLLQTLDSSSSGVIITDAIAEVYDLSKGDVLRVLLPETENETRVLVFSVLGIVAGLSDASEKRTDRPSGLQREFAKNVIWTSRRFLAPTINFTKSASNVLCVKIRENGNSTEIIHELLNDGGYDAIEDNGWVTVSDEVSNYVNHAEYSIDRSVDTMTTTNMILIICGGFVLYTIEDLRTRKREIALIRSMGAETAQVVKINSAEFLILTLSALTLILWFAPLLTTNSLLIYPTTSYSFPIKVFVVVPWTTLLSILMSFIACMLVLTLIIAITNTQVNLSRTLSASWSEAIHYRDAG